MGTWSSSEPTNLATSWTKAGDTGAINCYYCIRYRQDGVWHNQWFYYVMKVVGYIARTKKNQAVQKIELYVNDGNTSQDLYLHPQQPIARGRQPVKVFPTHRALLL